MFCGRGLALISTVALYNPHEKEDYYDLNYYNLISFPPLLPHLLHRLASL